MKEISERIHKILIDNKLNYSSFAKKINYSDVAVSKIIKGQTKPKFEFLSAVVEAFPYINPAWILTGKGRERGPVIINEDRTISETTYIANEPLISYDKKNKNAVPYFNVDVSFEIDILLQKEKPNGWINFPDFPKSDLVINVNSNDLKKGVNKIALLKISDKEIINFGDKYLIITKDYALVKTILKSDEKNNVKLISDNEKNPAYSISKSKIKDLYLVTYVFDSNTN